jgi:hypothetical protein
MPQMLDLEAGPEFAALRSLLSELPDREAEQVSITADDVRLLTGEPQLLRILVPVTIGG